MASGAPPQSTWIRANGEPIATGSAAAATVNRTSALRLLVELTKARLVSLVLVTTAVGFLMGGGMGDPLRLLWTMLGTALTAAGAMALNEVIEAERDARMRRTRQRPIPAGALSPDGALRFGIGSALVGVVVLALGANLLTAGLGLAVVVLYTLVYTPLKPRTTLCTLVGAVCGAIPPMMGWSAATGGLGFGAWVLGAVLFLWQVPHFLSLAWLYREDYARGGFRVLSVVDRSGRATTAVTNLYIAALLPVGFVAALGGLTGWLSAVGSVLLGGVLLALGIRLARTRGEPQARRLFLATLAYLPLLLALMVVDRVPDAGAHATVAGRAPIAGAAVRLQQ